MIGEVLELKGSLKQRSADGFSWHSIVRGEKVRNNHSLLSGQQSWARVRLFDKGEIEISESTLIHFRDQQKDSKTQTLRVELGQGKTNLSSKSDNVKLYVTGREINLKSASQVTASTGSSDRKTKVEVVRGSADILQKGENKTALSEGESASLSSRPEVEKAKISLLPKIIPPPPMGTLIDTGQKIRFQWENVSAEEIEIGTDPDSGQLKRHATKGAEIHLLIKPGKYYWRLLTRGSLSGFYSFTLLPTISYQFISPRPGATFTPGTRVLFEWASIRDAKEYVLQIAPTDQFQEGLIEKILSDASIELDSIPPGKHFWRVRARHEDFGFWPPSAVNSFLIHKPLVAPTPKAVKILEEESKTSIRYGPFLAQVLLHFFLPLAHAERPKVSLQFSWEPIEGAISYRFEMSATEEFDSVLKRMEVSRPTLTVKVPTRQMYYWRVAAIDEMGVAGAFCPPQQADVPQMLGKQKPSPQGVGDREDGSFGTVPSQRIRFSDRQPQSELKQTVIPRQSSFSFGGFALGVYDSASLQRVEGTDLRVELESNPYWTPSLEGYFNSSWGRLSGNLWYQRQSFRPKRPGNPSEIMHTFYGLELLRLDVFDFGLRFEKIPDFIRTESATVENQPFWYYAILMGRTFLFNLDNYYLRTQFLVEATPFGKNRGGGFIFRAGIGYAQLRRFFAREIRFTIRPGYMWISPGKSQWLVHFNVGLVLSWDFEVWELTKQKV